MLHLVDCLHRFCRGRPLIICQFDNSISEPQSAESNDFSIGKKSLPLFILYETGYGTDTNMLDPPPLTISA